MRSGEFDPDTIACARLVQQGDPLRFACTMAVPVHMRARLFAIYAFNVEISRAPWVTAEPLIAQMRLQWWSDVLEEIASGQAVRKHEVAGALARVLSPDEAGMLSGTVSARHWDIAKDPFADDAHLHRYLNDTAATLMVVAGRDEGLRGVGFAGGIAAWLHAVRALEEHGRVPLIDGTFCGLRALAQLGLEHLGPGQRRGLAALPAAGARGVLKSALLDPGRVNAGTLPPLDQPWSRLRARLSGRI